MAIENEVYADGVYQIHMLEQTIRLDFMRLQPSPENQTPVPKPFERVILSPQGFLRTYEAMGQIVRKLEELGLVRRNPNPPANPPAAQ
ncbi:MAG TPA: hypothetical protein IAC79_02850 [Candidatus Spyradenecus faecavium]|uniref:Uncharacterized protein n=1 Tax=Candidatus Spyradenecus faecavium TaxID=2840947 RepID=A0A9D1NN36_9BACT|nr:hypothetical protein [Candidatus Spyradenecus faecavium]